MIYDIVQKHIHIEFMFVTFCDTILYMYTQNVLEEYMYKNVRHFKIYEDIKCAVEWNMVVYVDHL